MKDNNANRFRKSFHRDRKGYNGKAFTSRNALEGENMAYTMVWFDLGLTLLEPHDRWVYQNALKEAGYAISDEEITRVYHITNKECMRNTAVPSAIRFKGFPLKLLKNLDHPLVLSEEESRRYWAYLDTHRGLDRWHLYPWTLDVLHELHDHGIRTGLLSNWDHSCRQILEENHLLSELDPLIISSEAGCEKPSLEIFEKALRESGCRADECLFIGDNYYDDVVGAAQAGIHTLLINPGRLGIEELVYKDVIDDIRGVLPWITDMYSA